MQLQKNVFKISKNKYLTQYNKNVLNYNKFNNIKIKNNNKILIYLNYQLLLIFQQKYNFFFILKKEQIPQKIQKYWKIFQKLCFSKKVIQNNTLIKNSNFLWFWLFNTEIKYYMHSPLILLKKKESVKIDTNLYYDTNLKKNEQYFFLFILLIFKIFQYTSFYQKKINLLYKNNILLNNYKQNIIQNKNIFFKKKPSYIYFKWHNKKKNEQITKFLQIILKNEK